MRKLRLFTGIRSYWTTFEYNFSWDDYSKYLNGYPAKAAGIVPLVGYLVLFNDTAVEKLSFNEIAGDVRTHIFVSPDVRLKLVFLGMFSLAFANLLYIAWRPWVIRFGETLSDFSRRSLDENTFGDFLRQHSEIRADGYGPWTQDGKYYDDDWDLFEMDATWKDSGRGVLAEKNIWEIRDLERVSYAEAKRKHESLLRSILRETYFREGREKRLKLCICIGFATIGYALLIVPSADLCLRVLQVIFLEAISDTWSI